MAADHLVKKMDDYVLILHESQVGSFRKKSDMSAMVCRICLSAVEDEDQLEHAYKHDEAGELVVRKKSRSFGEKNGNTKLTVEQVKEIKRLLHTRTQSWIAEQYGVSAQCIGHINEGYTWKHVTEDDEE